MDDSCKTCKHNGLRWDEEPCESCCGANDGYEQRGDRMDDLISRQQAIDALNSELTITGRTNAEAVMGYVRLVKDRLERLPSAQSEIIYCKDCQHFVRDDIEEYMPYGFYNTYFHAFCDKHWDKEKEEYIDVKIDDFCSFAERREE